MGTEKEVAIYFQCKLCHREVFRTRRYQYVMLLHKPHQTGNSCIKALFLAVRGHRAEQDGRVGCVGI